MDETWILQRFLARDEEGLAAAYAQLGPGLTALAARIAGLETAEECVNDAYLGAWNSIPPQTPDPLRAYICRIVRNHSLKKLRANTALKRGSQFEVSLSELEDCISGSSLDEQLAVSELTAQINAFLSALPRDDRVMFVKRYWFSESLSEIADTFAITENNASVRLSRIRGKLHQHLKEAAL